MEKLIKTTEGLAIILGLSLTIIYGKFWAIATMAAYILINIPTAIQQIRKYIKKLE